MIAYKLCRQLKNGDLTSLFINKSERILFGVWIEAQDYLTKGFKHRPGYHCLPQPSASHLSEINRVWVKVEIKDYTVWDRPKNQGGTWLLAKQIKFIEKYEIK